MQWLVVNKNNRVCVCVMIMCVVSLVFVDVIRYSFRLSTPLDLTVQMFPLDMSLQWLT